jgi:hypothetical protein
LVTKYNKLFIKAICDQRLAEINSMGKIGGDSLFYTQTMKNATRLRGEFNIPIVGQMEKIEYTHAFLLRTLPDDYLAAYLNLLRSLKVVVSTELMVYLIAIFRTNHFFGVF